MPSAGAFRNSERTQTSSGTVLAMMERAVIILCLVLLNTGLDCQSFFLFFLLVLAVYEATAGAPGGAGG